MAGFNKILKQLKSRYDTNFTHQHQCQVCDSLYRHVHDSTLKINKKQACWVDVDRDPAILSDTTSVSHWAEGGGWVRARLKRHCWLVVSIIRGLWGTERLPSDTIKSATTKQLKGL